MKKLLFTVLLLIPLLGYSQIEFYVAPFPLGNDTSGNGSILSPYGTIHKAQSVVRNYILGGMSQDVDIVIRGGTYILDQPLALTSADSGVNGFKVTYKSYNSEEVIVSGGVRISPPLWSLDQNGIWKANLNMLSLASIPVFRQMWVNGEKAQRSSHDVIVQSPNNYTDYSVDYIADNILNRHLMRKTHIQVLTKWKWHSNWLMVDDISSTTITFNKKSWFTKKTEPNGVVVFDNHRIIRIENAYEFIDSPGEWYYNKDTKYVYYYPQPGEEPDKAQVDVVIPVLEKLITANNVSNIEINGLTFSHASWLVPNDNGYFSGQASGYVEFDQEKFDNQHISRGAPYTVHRDSPANIEFIGSNNVKVSNCTFTHLGAEAISFEQHSIGNEIINNVFSDISGTAIRIGNGKYFKWRATDIAYVTKDNLVSGNTISNAANEYRSHTGIFLGYVQNTTVSLNTLSDLPYTGISIGLPVSREENEAGTLLGGNTIENNVITNVVHTLGDGGAIYNFGDSRNGQSSIINNQIYDIPLTALDPSAPRAAIYLDKFSNNFYVENNSGTAVGNYGQENANIFQNIEGCDGKDNIIENNDFEGCNTHWIFQKTYKPQFPISTANLDLGTRFVDVNNDQLKDMIYFRWISPTSIEKGVYLNNGHGWDPKLPESSPFVPPYHLAADAAGGNLGVQFVDVDDDGLEDMLYCRENYPNQCKAYKNTGSGWQYMSQYNPPKPHFNSNIGDLGVRYVDVDHDGDKDLIYFRWIDASTQDKGVYLNKGNGNGWGPELPPGDAKIPPYHISSDAYGDMGVKFVDLNDDDKLDMLYWRWNPSQKGAYINTGSGWQYASNYLPKQPMFENNVGDLGVHFADVDHNGRKDFIVYRTVSANQTDKFVYLNKNNTWEYVNECKYLPPTPLSTDQEGNQGVRFVDLNNDGYEDLIQGYLDNGLISNTYFNDSRDFVCNTGGGGGTPALVNLLGMEVPELINAKGIVVYPNPSQDVFNVSFDVMEEENISVKLYSVGGELIQSSGAKIYRTGNHTLTLDSEMLPDGIYILKFESKSRSIQKRVIKASR